MQVNSNLTTRSPYHRNFTGQPYHNFTGPWHHNKILNKTFKHDWIRLEAANSQGGVVIPADPPIQSNGALVAGASVGAIAGGVIGAVVVIIVVVVVVVLLYKRKQRQKPGGSHKPIPPNQNIQNGGGRRVSDNNTNSGRGSFDSRDNRQRPPQGDRPVRQMRPNDDNSSIATRSSRNSQGELIKPPKPQQTQQQAPRQQGRYAQGPQPSNIYHGPNSGGQRAVYHPREPNGSIDGRSSNNSTRQNREKYEFSV